MVEQLLLLPLVTNALYLVAHGDELVLRLLPVPLGDQVLNLVELGLRGQCDLVVTDLLGRTEEHGAQAIERVTGSRARHDRAESTEGQHTGGGCADDAQAAAAAHRGVLLLLGQPRAQRGDRVPFGDQAGRRRPAHLVAPFAEHRRQHGVGVVLGCHRAAGGQGVDELVAADDGVQRRFVVS